MLPILQIYSLMHLAKTCNKLLEIAPHLLNCVLQLYTCEMLLSVM